MARPASGVPMVGGEPVVLQDDYHDSAVKKDSAWISAVAFSPASDQVAVGSLDGRILLWDVERPRSPRLLRNPALETDTGGTTHVGVVTYVAFSPDGRALASCDGLIGQVLVWQLPDAKVRVRLQPAVGATIAAEFVDGHSRLVTFNEGGAAQVWRVGWSDLVRYLREATSATLLPDQRIHFLGETRKEARRKYEADERAHGRTPLPEGYQYTELDR
jgi:WD40 repeat protein